MRLRNRDVNQWLRDATEEVSRIRSDTRWVPLGNNWWRIMDESDNHLGWVDVKVCCSSGMAKFRYKPEATYHLDRKVPSVTVDARRLSDEEELEKLTLFDTRIVEAHNL